MAFSTESFSSPVVSVLSHASVSSSHRVVEQTAVRQSIVFQAANCACEMNCPSSSKTIAFEALQDPAHHCEGFSAFFISPSMRPALIFLPLGCKTHSAV